MLGGRNEARELLHRALDICKMNGESSWVPLATCLLDLSEFYFQGGDRRSARVLCEEAMEVLEAKSSADSPLG